ncbi:hypothetical protein HII31_12347 [Pseudocercospora fuligena]|uniref:SMP domain-containing protein n=1 Tax=Pseudocercospora fuligena TaxID=685502 RepID=A0A8H6R9E3_9PEZI|nr:hypothetical protein HII31_12347 [Pseudocercospora fuligena]
MSQRALRQLSLRTPARSFATSRSIMAAQQQPPIEASKVISETAKAEGGPEKGSLSAQMQSQVGKTQNFEQAAQEISSKMSSNPSSITSQDAAYLKSREARATGQAQPPSDSLSADAQRLASANEGATAPNSKSASSMTSEEQSASDRIENFEQVAENVAEKMKRDPNSLTKEEADLMHSREQRAFGTTSKGGIASQAQSLADENEK